MRLATEISISMLKYEESHRNRIENSILSFQAFRCAGLSVQQQQNESTTRKPNSPNLESLRSMAHDLIEQYFLPTVS